MKKLLGLFLAAILLLPAAAAARGRLDPSFGDGGRAVRAAGLLTSSYRPGSKVAESGDGHTYALLNERTVLAFTSGGQVETGFGANGVLEVFRPDDLVHGPTTIAVDRQGRLVVATTVAPNETPPPGAEREYEPEPVPEQQQAILLSRFTPAGQPDPSFGDGGRVLTRLGLPAPQIDPRLDFGPGRPRRARVATAGIAIDAAGRIVLSGSYLAGYEFCPGAPRYRQRRGSFLARLGEDGRPDPSFGASGVAPLREGPIGPPVPDRSGGVYVSLGAGYPCELSQRQAAGYLFHLDGAGIPVVGFGEGGWRVIAEDPFVEMLPDDRGGVILMPTNPAWRNSLTVRRLRADGSWDPGFGRGGAATPFPAPRGALVFSDAAIGPGGHIYVTGSWKRKPASAGPKRRFLLFRLDERGLLDRRFGVVRTGFGAGTSALSRFLLITPEGKPLALGPITDPRTGLEGLALARYLSR